VDFKKVLTHFKGAPGSPNPVKQNPPQFEFKEATVVFLRNF
jgi:hypothetical protein